VVKALNGAVDEVRKEQWGQASKAERITLKGLRWLLFMHSSKRRPEDIKRLKALYMNGNRRIHRAWVLKDEFDQFWEFDNQVDAKDFLDNWCNTANKSRLEPIKKFVALVRKHEDRLLPFVNTRLTIAIAEGLNRIIKIAKNRARGFRTLDALDSLARFIRIGAV